MKHDSEEILEKLIVAEEVTAAGYIIPGGLGSEMCMADGTKKTEPAAASTPSLQAVSDVGASTTNNLTVGGIIMAGGTSGEYLKPDGTKTSFASYLDAVLVGKQEYKTASFTWGISQMNDTVIINSASAVTVTISSVPYSTFNVSFFNIGAGDVTFVGSGITLNVPDGTILKTGKVATALKVMTAGSYWLKGELE